jgi:hypothetical protein
MNERIKELIEKATTIEYGVDNGFDRVVFDKEKFADLIVKECAGIYSKIDNGNLHMGTDDYLEALHRTFRS